MRMTLVPHHTACPAALSCACTRGAHVPPREAAVVSSATTSCRLKSSKEDRCLGGLWSTQMKGIAMQYSFAVSEHEQVNEVIRHRAIRQRKHKF